MPVISSEIDERTLTLVFTAEFDAPPVRVWQLWADARQLEQWWGPPTWPASFPAHDFTVGGYSPYAMTGPEGETSAAWLRFTHLDEPNALEFDDGFRGEDGEPDDTMPRMHGRVELESLDGGRTRMVTRMRFDSVEEMEQIVGMGMIEGMTGAMGQIDAILAGDAPPRP